MRRFAGTIRGGISEEAQDVLNNIAIAGGTLLSNEKDAIISFVDSEVLNGNWDLYDEIQFYGLSDSLARRAGWKGVANATGGTNATGGLSTNTGQFSTNINPSTLTNYSLNNAINQIYCLTNTDTRNEKWAFHCALSGDRLQLFQNVSDIRFFQNSSSLSTSLTTDRFVNQTYYGLLRDNSLTMDYLVNGVQDISRNIPSTGIPNEGIIIGRGSTQATWSFKMIGAGIGFDLLAHNNNVNTLLTELAII